MKRKIYLVFTALVVAASAGGFALAAEGDDDVEFPNPASVFCEEQGGTVEIVVDEHGNESGICRLAGGSAIDEWEYYDQSDSDLRNPPCCKSTANAVPAPGFTDGETTVNPSKVAEPPHPIGLREEASHSE